MRGMHGKLTVAGTIIVLAACAVATDGAGAKKRGNGKARAADPSLAVFPNCRAMKRYASRHSDALGSVFDGTDDAGGPKKTKGDIPQTSPEGDSTAGGDADTSGTNVQEAGVDEPDLVKSQGDLLFVATGGRLVALETGPGVPRELGSLSLSRTGRGGEGSRQLLLRGSRALVLNDAPDGLQILEIDISNPAAMRVTASMAVDGNLVDARQHGGVARIAIQSGLDVPAVRKGAVREGKAERPPNPVAKAKPRSLLPKSKLIVAGRKSKQPLVACSAVRKPGTFGGLDVMTVLTVDLDRGLPAVDSDAVFMSGETVYASAESLFVATGAFRSGELGGPTEIHRFSIEGATTSYEASGSVPGTMLNQFSMSEHEGVLRVASTKEPPPGRNRRAGQSFVTTLAQSGTELLPVGQVGGLGLGERIYAVRFLGDTGYVVTFRQVDPLYTLDLSVPSAPRVLGELKVRGYSAYLHPVGTDRLIGVGQDATPDGFTRGTQVSLFDVSNLAAPSLLSRSKLGGDSTSAVEFDHRAFLYWEPESLVVIPASVYGVRATQPSFEGAVAFRTSGGVQEVARFDHGPDPPPIYRAIVNSGRLVTVSDRGVLVSDIDALTPVGWVPF